MDLGKAAAHVSIKLNTAATLARVGVLRPHRPDRLRADGPRAAALGTTPAAGYMASTARFPDEAAIIDDSGTLTFREVHERSNALAHALAAEGIGVGDGVAIMCRNHRGFIEATIAASKLGANAIFLNTAFSGPQLADVARREEPRVIVYDEEFEEVLEEAGRGGCGRGLARAGRARACARSTTSSSTATARTSRRRSSRGKAILLTSGTTGTPKGASRSSRARSTPRRRCSRGSRCGRARRR